MTSREIDLAYAAGLIDGEGCIGVYRNSHNGQYQLRVTVEMTNPEGIAVLHDLFGGAGFDRPTPNPKWKDRTAWMGFNSIAEAALKELLPYLRVKRRQAEVALTANWSVKRASPGRRSLTTADQGQRSAVHEALRKLNKKGKETHV